MAWSLRLLLVSLVFNFLVPNEPVASLTALFVLPAFLCQIFDACARHHVPLFSATSMQSMVALVGEDVHFACTVDHIGRHTIAFIRNSTPPRLISYDATIFAPQRGKYELSVRGGTHKNRWTLTIKNAQPDDRGNFTCQVNTEPVMAKTAELHLKVPPTVSRTTPSVVEVREGQNVTLACHAEGSPPPTVIWRRNDRQIIRYHGNGGFGSSVFHGPDLSLVGVSRRHMAEYVCVASNGIPPEESWSIKLLVTFPPHALAKASMVSARKGQMARLVCDVEAWPRPEVTWSRGGEPLYENDHVAIHHSASGAFTTVHMLDLRHFSPEHDPAVYRCEARNENGAHYANIRLSDADANERLTNDVRTFEGSGLPHQHEHHPSTALSSSLQDVDSEDGDVIEANDDEIMQQAPPSANTVTRSANTVNREEEYWQPEGELVPETPLAPQPPEFAPHSELSGRNSVQATRAGAIIFTTLMIIFLARD